MNFKANMWVEKYRPKTLDDIVLPDDVRATFEKYKETGDTPHILLVGPPGIGKTSLAKIIVTDILGCQFLYINASDENGIDTIRTKISSFAQTKSIDGKIKCIILDESDGILSAAQRALRNVMEEYTSTTRFILTANQKHRITSAIASRCTSFDLSITEADIIKRLVNIIKQERITCDDGNLKDILLQIVKKYAPDMRQMINALQKLSVTGTISDVTKIVDTAFYEKILSLIEKRKIIEARKQIIQSGERFGNDYHNLMSNLLEFIYGKSIDNNIKRQMIVTIGEYMYRHTFVIDPEINCYCCLLTLENLFDRNVN